MEAILERPEIDRAARMMKERAFRGIAEMYDLDGKHEVMPLMSKPHARRMARLLWMAVQVEPERIDVLEQVAELCHPEGIAWDAPNLKRDIDELADVIRALSFGPESWSGFEQEIAS